MKVGLISFGLLVLYATACLATDCDVSEKNDCGKPVLVQSAAAHACILTAGYLGIDKKGCEDRGCCWEPTAVRYCITHYYYYYYYCLCCTINAAACPR